MADSSNASANWKGIYRMLSYNPMFSYLLYMPYLSMPYLSMPYLSRPYDQFMSQNLFKDFSKLRVDILTNITKIESQQNTQSDEKWENELMSKLDRYNKIGCDLLSKAEKSGAELYIETEMKHPIHCKVELNHSSGQLKFSCPDNNMSSEQVLQNIIARVCHQKSGMVMQLEKIMIGDQSQALRHYFYKRIRDNAKLFFFRSNKKI